MLSLLPTPLLYLTFSVLPPNQLKKPKPQKKSRLISTEKNLLWGEITYFVQSDVNIFWFSFWLSRFLFSSAKWKPFVQSEIRYLNAVVVLNKKEIKKNPLIVAALTQYLFRVCFLGITQPTLLLSFVLSRTYPSCNVAFVFLARHV